MVGATPPPPRFRLERAARGYRVVGPDLVIWEATLGEAIERREELEGMPTRHAPGAAPRLAVGFAGDVVYGPVHSRRLGRSLGVSLTPPGRRVCNFDCVYCAWGGPRERRGRPPWPAPERVGDALSRALQEAGPLDSITISGHGEPTLHPRFARVVEAICRAAAARPEVPVRILTNASRALRPDVRDALDRLDERIVKIDAAPERIERPRRVPLGALLAGLARLRDVTVQSCFVEGAVANTDPGAIDDWIGLLAELRPRAVQIYTIDLPAAHAGVLPATAAQLEEIACRLRARTGIEAGSYA